MKYFIFDMNNHYVCTAARSRMRARNAIAGGYSNAATAKIGFIFNDRNQLNTFVGSTSKTIIFV